MAEISIICGMKTSPWGCAKNRIPHRQCGFALLVYHKIGEKATLRFKKPAAAGRETHIEKNAFFVRQVQIIHKSAVF